MVTQARLHELFEYDADTGSLIWKVARRRVKVGAVAGSINKVRGYREIRIDGRSYKAHRLVWMWHHGKWPEREIDHIDRNKLNNKIENLRDVSRAINLLNRDQPNALGFAGVSRNKSRFEARIRIFGKDAHLGTYDTPEEAHHVFKRVHFDLHREHSQYAPEFAELAA